jgi:acetyltransferase-like isoleucine patch superfamily enzyme
VRLGRAVYVGKSARLAADSTEGITIGDHTEIYDGALLMTYGGVIRIGANVGINPYCVLYGHGGLTIGDDTLIAAHVVIIPANHKFDRGDVPIRSQGLTCRGVTIGKNVWLGARTVILDGVSIGEGAVIGAGSVVTRSIPQRAVAVGVPARVVKVRS